MSGVNKVTLLGHLGKDPEMKTLTGDVKVANFSLATTEIHVKDGKKTEHTEWHNIVAWRNLASVSEKYLKKGTQVYLEGKIKSRTFEDKGVKKIFTEIIADNMVLFGKKDKDSMEASKRAVETVEDAPGKYLHIEDMPF